MHRLGLVVAIAAVVSIAAGQDNALKSLNVPPATGDRPIAMTALAIERGAEYPSVVNLRGSVEIKVPICAKKVCDGEMMVRADEADFREDTGEIRPRGNVIIGPVGRMNFAAAVTALNTAVSHQTAPLGHFTFTGPGTGDRAISLTAVVFEQRADYPSAVGLRGRAEIKIPVCTKGMCDGEIVIRADEVDLQQGGEIRPRGDVVIATAGRVH